jgi:hypothetical protein
MKRFTYITCSLIVACMAAAINPNDTKQIGKRYLIKGTPDLAEERNNFP